MASFKFASLAALLATVNGFVTRTADKPIDIYALRNQVLSSLVVQDKIAKTCKAHQKMPQCEQKAGDALFCELLGRSHPDLATEHCSGPKKAARTSGPVFLQVTAAKA